MLVTKEEKKVLLTSIKAEKKVSVLISDEVWYQAKMLCDTFKNIEWSGIILYDVVDGNIEKLIGDKKEDILNLVVKFIIPMDKGTAGSTRYTFTPEVVKYIKGISEDFNIPFSELMKLRVGHMHSHHSMGTSFSTTDNDELDDNVRQHNGYLSIITNNRNEYTAKFAVYAKVQNTYSIISRDIDGKEINTEKKNEQKESMIVYEADISFEEKEIVHPKTFLNAVETLKNQSSSVSSYTTKTFYAGSDGKKLLTTGPTEDKKGTKSGKSVLTLMEYVKTCLCNAYYEILPSSQFSIGRIMGEIETLSQANKQTQKAFEEDLKTEIRKVYDYRFKTEKDFTIKSYTNVLQDCISMIENPLLKENYPYASSRITACFNNVIQTVKKVQPQKV